MPVERRASACKRDDANQMARTIMSKDCNRGQSAMWRVSSVSLPFAPSAPFHIDSDGCSSIWTSGFRRAAPHGEPYAGKLHVRFDEGAGVPDNKGRPALLYTPLYSAETAVAGDIVALYDYRCS